MKHLFVFLVCIETAPQYVTLPESKCAEPGDDVYIECSVLYAEKICSSPLFNTILFEDSNGNMFDTNHMGNIEVNNEKL